MRWLKSKKLWAAVAFVGIAVAGTQFALKRRAAKPPVQWETASVDRGRIVARVTATGILSALVTVQVGSQVSGSIQKLYADFNSPVKKGQIIAKIDPRLFQASLENARANYAQAKATLMKDEVQARFAERQSKRLRVTPGRSIEMSSAVTPCAPCSTVPVRPNTTAASA